MSDPLEDVKDSEFRDQLLWLRTNGDQTVESERLARLVKGFRSQKGIYKPSGSEYALWVRQTLRGVYPDEEPVYRADDLSWTYRYAPEGRGGRTDMDLDTNRALLRCKEDGVPVGVMRQVHIGAGPPSYEILGLAYVEGFDGTHFILRGEGARWDLIPRPGLAPEPFRPFEDRPARLSPQLRRWRDHRFGEAVRRLYHGRCSLCQVGYRVRGRVLGLEAAHIIPIKERGNPVDLRNGMLLCSNHHVLFDEFAWTPDEDLCVLVMDDEEFRRSAAANCVLEWEGKRLPNLPAQTNALPAPEAVRYRLEQFERR